MSEWQPIETAPNDQTDVLVWDGAEHWIAHQNSDGYWSAKLAFAVDDRGGFYLDSKEYAGLTHWMPLPEPPK